MELAAAHIVTIMQAVQYELVLLAAVGIALLGTEDVAFDLLWLMRRRPPAPPAPMPIVGPIAVFVPAWRESAVLAGTIAAMLDAWQDEDVRIYVGCYPNDAATLFAISPAVAAHPRLRLVIGERAGPTSKADNLNSIWRAMGADERAERAEFAAVVLHDAEDHVHGEEIALFRRTLPGRAMVQIPVEPIIEDGLIAAHYADEFAEAHGKELPLRAALRAGLPAAGTGCAFSRRALVLLALERAEGPFQADSLTEDYEVGIMLGAAGAWCHFVEARGLDGRRIAVRSAFPETLEACVRQKSRWVAGIAFAGWDRLSWSGLAPTQNGTAVPRSLIGAALLRWMLWRDRRAPLAACVILAAYLAMVLTGIDAAGALVGWWQAMPVEGALAVVLMVNAMVMAWRLGMRMVFSASVYGWRQGLLAVPRAFVGNVIHILAARRAFAIYMRQLHTRELVWDKTDHRPIGVIAAVPERR